MNWRERSGWIVLAVAIAGTKTAAQPARPRIRLADKLALESSPRGPRDEVLLALIAWSEAASDHLVEQQRALESVRKRLSELERATRK